MILAHPQPADTPTTPPTLAACWTRLGAAFNVEPAPATPDLERLLLDTARAMPGNPRLLPVVGAWLNRYGEAVARHRLRAHAATQLQAADHPALGLLLETASTLRFKTVCAALTPADPPRPLYTVQTRTAALTRRAQRLASPLALRWGVWASPVDLKHDTLRSPAWIHDQNPDLIARLDFRGDLRASVLAALQHDPPARASELALTRALGATRQAVRDALDNLELTGKARRTPEGRRTRLQAVDRAAAR